jgi:hypothetical protein
MPSVSSARRSAVDSVDMRAENKSEVGRAGKDKENSEDVRAFLSQGGKEGLEKRRWNL